MTLKLTQEEFDTILNALLVAAFAEAGICKEMEVDNIEGPKFARLAAKLRDDPANN